MKYTGIIIFVVAVVVIGGVLPALQFYNYVSFKREFVEDRLDKILRPLSQIDDEAAATARQLIIEEITKAGYEIDEETGVVFKAHMPGMVRALSNEIYQITDTTHNYGTLFVDMEFHIRILIFRSRRTLRHERRIKS